jgi:hypothetical protein
VHLSIPQARNFVLCLRSYNIRAMLKTPTSVNSNVLRLLKKMSLSGPPYYVPVIPEFNAQLDACFINVDQKIRRSGGKLILGWAIWENEFMVEAEFHGVWNSANGQHIDLTPKLNNEARILFVMDPSAKYENFQVDNFRLNTSGNSLVDDYIELFRARFRLLNKGERKNVLGEIHLNGRDADMYTGIELMIHNVHRMLSNSGSRNSLCFCGSGLKYKNCHGKDLKQILQKV